MKFKLLLLTLSVFLHTVYCLADFSLVDDFESYTAGSAIDGLGDWTSDSALNQIAVDPANASNKVLLLSPLDTETNRTYNDSALVNGVDGSVVTLFLRFRMASGSLNVNFGLSDLATPGSGTFNDFEAQARAYEGIMDTRDTDLNLLVEFLKNPIPFSSSPRDLTEQLGASARFVSGFGLVRASNGLSPIGPPWTTLTAYDLNAGTIQWQIPLGEVPELSARGIKDTGSVYQKVGPVVTAGGLLFAGTKDKKVRAFDLRNGTVLWEAEVGAAVEGIPAVYQVDGRQYILFCAAAQAGLTRESEEPIQGQYIAFALPD